jgi:uncharacterized RDD family membrane protein YckC
VLRHQHEPVTLGRRHAQPPQEVLTLLAFLGVLLLIWLAFMVLGAVIKGLFWLIIVGAVLFVATVAYGWAKQKARSSSR